MKRMSKSYTFEVTGLEGDSDAGNGSVVFVASTINPDREKDTVDPAGGSIKTKSVHLLYGHNSKDINQLLGTVTDVQYDKEKLYMSARFNSSPNGQLARELIKSGDINQFSISVIVNKAIPNAIGGLHCKEWELLEVSLVPNPSNRDTEVINVKSVDELVEVIDEAPVAEVTEETVVEPETVEVEAEELVTEDPQEIEEDDEFDEQELADFIQANADAIRAAVLESLKDILKSR